LIEFYERVVLERCAEPEISSYFWGKLVRQQNAAIQSIDIPFHYYQSFEFGHSRRSS
jgi:hypothetical protein